MNGPFDGTRLPSHQKGRSHANRGCGRDGKARKRIKQVTIKRRLLKLPNGVSSGCSDL